MSKSSSERVTPGSFVAVSTVVAVLALVACGGSGGGGKTGGAGMGGAGTSGSSGATATGAAGAVGAGGSSGGAGTSGAAGTGAAGTGAAGNGTTTGVGGAGGTTNTAGAAGSAGATGQGGGAGGAPDAGTDAAKDATADVAAGPFALTSSAFTEGMEIPLPYKCTQSPPAGTNMTPPLSWTAGPPGTKSYAVTLNHMAADNSAHWALWDIPVATMSLAPNIDHVAMPSTPAGAKQAQQNLDGFVGIGYQGPCPQAANQTQKYVFTVWAIGVATLPGVTSASTTAAAQTAIKKAALPAGSATLVGTQLRTP